MPEQRSQATMSQLSFTDSSQCLHHAAFPCASTLLARAVDIMLCQSPLQPLGLRVLGRHMFFPQQPFCYESYYAGLRRY